MRKKKVDPAAFAKLLAGVDRLAPDERLPSPCIGVCQMNTKTKFCDGCFRTLDEIAEWGAIDDAPRRSIWLLLKRRYAERRK
ncbi:MAG TPA: DUF1289 domain-containing protein [Herminiimonas sp.]|nr:DUF1289 domain-containing protein [Herminiimonas sp.]